jgi:zinc transporter ZupT
MFSNDVYGVFSYAMLTAIACGLGAIPLFFFKNMSRNFMGLANAFAAGLMLGASFSLIYEGLEYSLPGVIAGMAGGLLFIVVSDRVLQRYDNLSVSNISNADARKTLLIIVIMTLHSLTEGIGVGVAFGGGEKLGVFITAAIAIHNIPEGLAISLVSVPRGMSVWKAMWWSIFSSLPQPLMAVPAFMFVEHFKPFLPVGFGFAAGAMIWMVFSELINEANEDSSPGKVGITVTLSIMLMIIFQEMLK